MYVCMYVYAMVLLYNNVKYSCAGNCSDGSRGAVVVVW